MLPDSVSYDRNGAPSFLSSAHSQVKKLQIKLSLRVLSVGVKLVVRCKYAIICWVIINYRC